MGVAVLRENTEKDYILDVDLEYPQKPHDTHNLYSLAPERFVVSSRLGVRCIFS